MNNVDNFKDADNDTTLKIKSIEPYIIVAGSASKPYYELLYYDLDDRTWHIGFGSYELSNVVLWRKEYFEVIDGIAEMTHNNPVWLIKLKHYLRKWLVQYRRKK